MTSLEAIPLDDESDSQQELSESCGPAIMARDILQFLDVSPMSLLNITRSSENNDTFNDVLGSFILCVTSPRHEIRRRASSVAKRLFTQSDSLEGLQLRKKHVPTRLKKEYWRKRCSKPPFPQSDFKS